MALHRSGKPKQNAFIESFNGRLRDEFLNETLFTSLAQARHELASWREDYNTIQPHGSLGQMTPAAYAELSAPWMQRAGALEPSGGSAPQLVAPPSPMGSNAEWMKVGAQVTEGAEVLSKIKRARAALDKAVRVCENNARFVG
jgi:hypothetical protein